LAATLLDPGRTWQLGAAAVAVAIGVLAGMDPKLAVAAALGLGFVLLVIVDLSAGLYLFVLVSFLDIAEFGGVAVSFSKLAGLLLAASWLAVIATRTRPTRDFFASHPAITLLAVGFIGWSLLSATWAEEPGRALDSTIRYALNLCLLPIVFTAVQRREQLTWVAAAFVAGAIGSMLLGAVSGSSFTAVGDAPRLAGGIGESNELATVLVASVVFALALFASRRTPAPIRAAALVAAPIALVGIAATLSRAGLVALTVALLVGLVVGGRWRAWFAGALVVGGLSAVIYLAAFAAPAARERVQSTNSTGRTDIWTIGSRMVEAHPVRGIGGGNFPVASIHYLLRPGVIRRDDFIIETPKVAHNIYLEIQAELGAAGLLLFVALLVFSIRSAMRAALAFKRQGDAHAELLARVVVIALAGILAADFFASEQYSKQLWLLLALGPAMLALAGMRTGGEQHR
jgi:O-antigen ligase